MDVRTLEDSTPVLTALLREATKQCFATFRIRLRVFPHFILLTTPCEGPLVELWMARDWTLTERDWKLRS